jgi:hypothetical protein
MDLEPYVENIRRELLGVAEAGGEEARELGERLLRPLDSAIRLAVQDALVAAAEEITCELAPGSVEVRLRGRDPEFVVTPPPVDTAGEEPSVPVLSGPADRASAAMPEPGVGASADDEPDGAMSRINLRMPEQLKARIENIASGEGVSVNSWLVRAATAALERTDFGPRRESRATRSARRYTGWAR